MTVSSTKVFSLNDHPAYKSYRVNGKSEFSSSKNIGVDNYFSLEMGDMSNEFITKSEFNQFEKRVDEKFLHLNSKIDDLPNRFEDKLKLSITQMQNEIIIKQNNNTWKAIGVISAIVSGVITILKFVF